MSVEIRHRFVEANGLRFHVAEAGAGPLVLLCHGFPELWYSWRHQIDALAAAGFRAVAPDLRGYGQSDAPDAIEAYAMPLLVGDLVGIVGALGAERAHLVGHDWGSALAWQAAIMRPDVFPTIVGMSVPFQPRREGRRPVAAFRQIAERDGLGEFYMVRFQAPGVGFQRPRVTVEVLARPELQPVHEDAHHRARRARLGDADQPDVPVVQVAHGGHEHVVRLALQELTERGR